MMKQIFKKLSKVTYQPQITLASNRILSAEALIRWRHPHRGLVAPMEFIEIAEESGLVVPIAEWVLDTVCQQIAQWAKTHGWSPTIAVNISAQQMKTPGFMRHIEDIIAQHGIDPGLVELELTEHSVMTECESASILLRQLKDRGVRLVLDDFGTGYSNMVTLSRLPFDVLKIDRSLIQELPNGRESLPLTGMSMAMAQQLGLEVVAEGVENAEQGAYLRSVGCHYIQGYLYSPPIPGDQFSQMVFGPCQ